MTTILDTDISEYLYLWDLPMDLLEQELANTEAELATVNETLAVFGKYGGSFRDLKKCRIKKELLKEKLVYIKSEIEERKKND